MRLQACWLYKDINNVLPNPILEALDRQETSIDELSTEKRPKNNTTILTGFQIININLLFNDSKGREIRKLPFSRIMLDECPSYRLFKYAAAMFQKPATAAISLLFTVNQKSESRIVAGNEEDFDAFLRQIRDDVGWTHKPGKGEEGYSGEGCEILIRLG